MELFAMELLAQNGVDAGLTNSWAQVIAGITSLGFAVWYAWYTTTKTIPGMNRQHSEAMIRAISEFRQEVREQRDLYTSQLQEAHSLNRMSQESIQQVSRAIHDLKAAISESRHATRSP